MGRFKVLTLFFVVVATVVVSIIAATDKDDYTVADGNKSFVVALGCFWCAEQAFEQYAPGVIEAVSGYSGGTNDNPKYRDHPGHYEVILIEYDPSKTSYELLVEYAYRNMDPFNGDGQFCDNGSSYYPAIFFETDDERIIAENVLIDILDMQNWDEDDIKAPILERATFWTAEEYHQDYYIKNPSNYGFYKNGCRRTQRLKEVWGEEEYKCYHDESYSCFNETVVNTDGDEVTAELNTKNAPEEIIGLLPRWATILVSILGGIIVVGILVFIMFRYNCCNKKRVE
jgi:peptide-methionine (S)-S-oxide reductase